MTTIDREQMGRCCYGGVKPKHVCGSCAGWQPLADADIQAIVQRAVDEERKAFVMELDALWERTVRSTDGVAVEICSLAYKVERSIGQPVEIDDERENVGDDTEEETHA